MAHGFMGAGYNGEVLFHGKDNLVASLDVLAHQAAIKNEEL